MTTDLEALRRDHREGAALQRAMMRAEQGQRVAPERPVSVADQTRRAVARAVTPVLPAAIPQALGDQSARDADARLAELERFLAMVVPPGGPIYFPAVKRRSGGMAHYPCSSLPRYAQRLLALGADSCDVYFAPAAFQQEWITVRGQQKQRCQENVASLQASWADLDVDAAKAAAGAAYATQADALAALDAFSAKLGIAPPTFIVSSGHGLHVYWAFFEPVAPAQWQCVANALKRACRIAGLRADPSCTADSARVLRPPGTSNRKDPANPLPVTILQEGEPVEFGRFRAAVERIAGSAVASTAETDAPSTGADALPIRMDGAAIDNSDLSAGLYELHPYLRGLTREAQLTLIDTACAAIPDSDWATYAVWAETAMKGLRGLQWEDESPLLDIISRHTYQQDRPTLAEKFYSWDGGSIGPLFELAERRGWRAAAALPASDGEAAPPAEPIENEPALERYLTGKYALVRSRGEGEYFDFQRRLSMRPGAVSRSEGHLTRSVGKTADRILKESPLTQRVDLLGFHPAQGATYTEDGCSYVNLHCPVAEEIHPTDAEARLLVNFLDYLFPWPEDQVFKHYYVQFLAHIVQRPAVKIATALLFVGGFGVGKNTAAYDIPSLIVGLKNSQVVSNKVLSSNFSDQLGKAHLVYLDEVHCNGSWQSQDQANNLKSLVSDKRLVVHPKGHAAYDIPNRVIVTATSNYEDAMFLQANDRRWAVHEVNPARAYTPEQHRQYFNALHRLISSPRAGGVLRWFFGRVNLAGFDAQNPPPMTAAKARMVEGSRSPLEDEITALFESGEAPFNRELFTLEDLRLSLRLRAPTLRDVSPKRLAAAVRAAPISAERLTLRPRNAGAQGLSRPRYWALRNAEAWSDASNDEIQRHMQMGGPPLRATPDIQIGGAETPDTAVTQPAEAALPAPPVEHIEDDAA